MERLLEPVLSLVPLFAELLPLDFLVEEFDLELLFESDELELELEALESLGPLDRRVLRLPRCLIPPIAVVMSPPDN